MDDKTAPVHPATSEDCNDEVHPLLAALIPIIPALAEAIGRDCEVLLHDLSKLPNSIIQIGGHVTGRQVGGPMTDLLARLIRQGRTDHVKNYNTVLPDGRILRSSTLFLKDASDTAVGCLCVNMDITDWMKTAELIAERVGPSAGPQLNSSSPSLVGNMDEFFVTNVEDLQKSMVTKAITAIGIPLELMTKGHKMKVVQMLEESGFFLIRDSAEYLAQAIGVTRYTIYNYLNQLRVSNKFTGTEEDLEGD